MLEKSSTQIGHLSKSEDSVSLDLRSATVYLSRLFLASSVAGTATGSLSYNGARLKNVWSGTTLGIIGSITHLEA